jgi:hypothetical protein
MIEKKLPNGAYEMKFHDQGLKKIPPKMHGKKSAATNILADKNFRSKNPFAKLLFLLVSYMSVLFWSVLGVPCFG